jgi:hypothetical protein
MLLEVVLNPEKNSGHFRFWNRFIVNFICCRKPEVMGAMAKFSKYESLSAVKKDKSVGNKAMFGTNKLCMKGIYLPTFQRSIILRANEGYKKITV